MFLFKVFPERIIRYRGNNFHRFFFNRVDQVYFSGMQMDGCVLIGSGCPVLKITLDHTANIGKLHPDLVMPAREQIYFQQLIVVGRCQKMIIKLSFQLSFSLLLIGIGSIFFLIFLQVVGQVPILFGGIPAVTAQYIFLILRSRIISFRRERALLVRAKITAPLTGLSRR